MIKEIDGLKIPLSVNSRSELFNEDFQRRTVSGRLITKYGAAQKWRCTVLFEQQALSPEMQAAFYAKCAEMRRESRPVILISPYDGIEYVIMAKCVTRATPSVKNIFARKPQFYLSAGAVFEQV